MRTFSLLIAYGMVTFTSAAFAEPPQVDPSTDWPWWRGPSHNGKAHSSQQPPAKFGPNKNLIWKAPVPGRGHASPCIVGDRLFLSTADVDAKTQSVLAYDKATGKQLWAVEVNKGNFPAKIHGNNTHASPTIASDGERVFASFYNNNSVHVVALTVNGKPAWSENVGPFHPTKYEFGYGASPLLHEDNVIVVGDQVKGGFLAALNRKTGKITWRTERPADINYASPILTKIDGKDQILISGMESIRAYDPIAGKELWKGAGGAPQTCGTVVTEDGIVFASGGYPKKQTVAIKVSTGELLWDNNKKAYEQSMLVHQGYLYSMTDNGIFYCWNAKTGEEQWAERLKGPVSISPILVGDRIYAANERGQFFVFKANPNKFELIAKNELGEETFATPAFVDNRIYIRVGHQDDDGKRNAVLYCFGK